MYIYRIADLASPHAQEENGEKYRWNNFKKLTR
jgi:hypothetical protein